MTFKRSFYFNEQNPWVKSLYLSYYTEIPATKAILESEQNPCGKSLYMCHSSKATAFIMTAFDFNLSKKIEAPSMHILSIFSSRLKHGQKHFKMLKQK